ncbi:hypothetical protein ACM66B_004703 [Microbotryomycetes sp. NB124-2]
MNPDEASHCETCSCHSSRPSHSLTSGHVVASSNLAQLEFGRHGELVNVTPSAAALFFPGQAVPFVDTSGQEPITAAFFLSSDSRGEAVELLDGLAHEASKLQWSQSLTIELWRGTDKDQRSSMWFDVIVERLAPVANAAAAHAKASVGNFAQHSPSLTGIAADVGGDTTSGRSTPIGSPPPSSHVHPHHALQRQSTYYSMLVLRPSIIKHTDPTRAATNAQLEAGVQSTPVLETWTKLSRQALNRLTSTWHEREERPSSDEVYSALQHMTARVVSSSQPEDKGLESEMGTGTSSISGHAQISSEGVLNHVGLAQLVDHLPTICFTSSPDGQVTWLNKAWSEFTGLGPVESLDFQTWQSMFNEEDLVRVVPVWVNAMATGDPFSFEYRVKRRDGTQRWCVCAGRAVKDDNDKVVNWCCSIVEVEGLVRARAEALRVKEHIKLVLSTADIVLLSIDSNRVITFFEGNVELARSLGHPDAPPRSDAIIAGETRLEDLWGGDEQLHGAIEQILGRQTDNVSLLSSYGDGAQYVQYQLMAMKGESSQCQNGVVIIATNATLNIKTEEALKESYQMQAELRASETAANEANRLKTEFLSVISHEIRTPIAGVLSICELLQASSDLSQEHRLLVQKAARCGENLLELVGMVLDVRKVEAGELELEEAPIRVGDVLEDAKLFSLAVTQKQLDFYEEIGECYSGFLLGDRLRIRQILANGLSNAIKFTKHGSVTLRLRQEESPPFDDRVWLRFEIQDTGVGIHADVLPTLFQPFKQADASTARRFGGSGLGLVISRKFAELMGGQAWLESALGRGTKMVVRVPLRKAPPEAQLPSVVIKKETMLAEATAMNERAALANRRASLTRDMDPAYSNNGNNDSDSQADKVKVLLAEDNDVLREILSRTLMTRNFDVFAVEDGASAVAEAHNNVYDLVLMDGQMPGMSGYGATKLIRESKDERVRALPIIALTASAIEGDRERCLGSGMNDYLSKPVRADDLEAAIWRQLRHARITHVNAAAEALLFRGRVRLPQDGAQWLAGDRATGKEGLKEVLEKYSDECRLLKWGQTVLIGCKIEKDTGEGRMICCEAVVERTGTEERHESFQDVAWRVTLVRPSSSGDTGAPEPDEPRPSVAPAQTHDQATSEEDEQVDTSDRMPNALNLYPTLDHFTDKLAEIGVSEVMTQLTHLTTKDEAPEPTKDKAEVPLREALKQTRNVLTQTEMLRLLDSLAPMAFVTDAQGQLLWLSEAYYEYTNCGPTCTSADFVRNYFEGDLHRVLPIYMDAIARAESYKFEYRLRRADGSYEWFLCEGNPIKDDGGNVLMYAGSITNVDELVKSRHHALSVRAHVRAALMGANIVIVSLDTEFRIQFYEGDLEKLWDIQRAHEGVPGSDRPEIVVGETRLDEVWPDERVKNVVQEAVAAPDQYIARMLTYQDVEGQPKYSRYRIGATRGGPGRDDTEVTGVVIVAGDVTSQINADALLKKTVRDREEAQEASRLKTSFLQLLSHEIRSPIAGMIGICELLLDDTSLSGAHRSLVSKCLRMGEIQLELVNAVLDLRKLEQNEMTIESEAFELEQLIADARLYSLAAQQKGLTYTDVMEEGIYEATLLGDRLRLRQVLANALSNAIKFTPSGGVTFRVRQTSETADFVTILFTVDDTGIGIPQHVLPTLFQPFKQADASTARTHGGTGLGLAIAKNLVELMGGTCKLTSVEGKGTTFSAEITLRKAPYGHARKVEYGASVDLGAVNGTGTTGEQRDATDVKVLLAEDNEVLRTIVTKLLAKMGFQVSTAEDGAGAIQAASETEFDVILMDVMMPKVDGYAATRAIRKMGHRTKIIALTANAILGDEEACLEAGMHAYISKPVRAKHLEETIWRVLREGA